MLTQRSLLYWQPCVLFNISASCQPIQARGNPKQSTQHGHATPSYSGSGRREQRRVSAAVSVPRKGEGLTLAPQCLYERRDFPGQPETCQVAREDTGADCVGGSASLLHSTASSLGSGPARTNVLSSQREPGPSWQHRLEVSAWRASPTSETVLGLRSERPWSALLRHWVVSCERQSLPWETIHRPRTGRHPGKGGDSI